MAEKQRRRRIMMKKKNISMTVIRRLPKYHRYLHDLLISDIRSVSSEELGRKNGFTAVKVRQDLNNFGDFGCSGYGYNVRELYNHICEILDINEMHEAVIVGAGNIGQAISNYSSFKELGFMFKGMFDVNPKMVGLRIGEIEIQDIDFLPEYLHNNEIQIGVVSVPAKSAQGICDVLVANGIKAIWNFAPVDLVVPEDVIVENVSLSSSLLTLTYFMKSSMEDEKIIEGAV